MAASKSYFPKSKYRFLPSDYELSKDSMTFELEESDVWDSDAPSELSKPSPRFSTKSVATAAAAIGSASMPVNVPDWSKILKNEYKENRRNDWDGDDYGVGEEDGNRIPPHEFLARNRIASSSVHEGIGRTLKGRDLSRVRNAIWQKTGFQD